MHVALGGVGVMGVASLIFSSALCLKICGESSRLNLSRWDERRGVLMDDMCAQDMSHVDWKRAFLQRCHIKTTVEGRRYYKQQTKYRKLGYMPYGNQARAIDKENRHLTPSH